MLGRGISKFAVSVLYLAEQDWSQIITIALFPFVVFQAMRVKAVFVLFGYAWVARLFTMFGVRE